MNLGPVSSPSTAARARTRRARPASNRSPTASIRRPDPRDGVGARRAEITMAPGASRFQAKGEHATHTQNRTFECRGLSNGACAHGVPQSPTAAAQTLRPPSLSPRSPEDAPGARESDQRRGEPWPANLAAQRRSNNLKITLARTHHDSAVHPPIGDGEVPPAHVHGHAR